MKDKAALKALPQENFGILNQNLILIGTLY